MKLQKTIKAKIIGLTSLKENLLRQEYDNWQLCLQGGKSIDLYLATQQQADRFLKKLGKEKKDREYPMILRNDVINLKETDNKLAKVWLKIPIANFKGGVKVPLQLPYNQEKLLKFKLRESKLIWKSGHWSVHITVETEVSTPNPTPNVLAIDLGEKVIATSVKIADGQIREPRFMGKNVRGIRRHYAWLRKVLGEGKHLDTIKKVKDTERRKVNAILHKISRDIVDSAKKDKCTIVLGSLKGIRKSAKGKGKRFNRIVANMPYFKLTQMIEYKAMWDGVPVVYIREWSSKICHTCNNIGKRPTQGKFVCPICGEYNADLNCAVTHGKRFSSYMLENGAVFDTARNLEAQCAI